MPGSKPANLSTISKDFPPELLDQLNYVISDIYALISRIMGNDNLATGPNATISYISGDDVTFDLLNTNGVVGTQTDQVARGDRGVENGSNHDHVGGDGAAITEAAVTLADNTTIDVSTTKHGLVPKAPSDTTKFLRGDASWAVPAYHTFVDRGDPSAWDFELAALTTDGAWHDMDLSAVVPSGAIAVLLRCNVTDDVAGSVLWFRKNGNSNPYNMDAVTTQVAHIPVNASSILVFCDANRVIEYLASNTTFSSINIVVRGWFI